MRLLRAELRKLLTTKVWIFLLLGAVVLSLLTPTFTLGFAGDPQSGLPPITSPQIQVLALQGPAQAVIFTVILGIIGMTQEYRHRTAMPTFLATPQRWKVVTAKLVLYLLVGVVFAAVAAALVYAEVAIWVGANGESVPLTGDNAKTLIGAAGAAALYGVVGVGVGALVRNQVGAIVAMLAYSFVAETILRGFEATQQVYKYLPGGASTAMYTLAQPAQSTVDLLAPWQGAVLLLGYGVVAAAVALVVSTRRDVD